MPWCCPATLLAKTTKPYPDHRCILSRIAINGHFAAEVISHTAMHSLRSSYGRACTVKLVMFAEWHAVKCWTSRIKSKNGKWWNNLVVIILSNCLISLHIAEPLQQCTLENLSLFSNVPFQHKCIHITHYHIESLIVVLFLCIIKYHGSHYVVNNLLHTDHWCSDIYVFR